MPQKESIKNNSSPISFKIKWILFLCVSWIILPLALLGLFFSLIVLMASGISLQDMFRVLKDLSIPFLFFFLLNFPNKSYTKNQKIICWVMIIADTLALFAIYFAGSHF